MGLYRMSVGSVSSSLSHVALVCLVSTGFQTSAYARYMGPQAFLTAQTAAPSAEPEDQDSEGLGSPQPDQPESLVETFFGELSADNVQAKAEALFSPSVTYDDPSGHYDGRDNAIMHLRTLLGGMQNLSVDVREEFVSGDETVALWTASFSQKNLNSGVTVTVDGVTHVKVQGAKIVAVRDYYDLGASYYEHMPVLGSLVRWFKAKLTLD